MSEAVRTPKLPLATKVAYGVADLGINVFVIFKGLLVFAFLVQFSGVDPALAGWVTSAVLVIDVITDPLMGWISDRTGGRFGRRHPYIISGAVLMALLMIVTFAVPAGLSETAAALWVFIFFAAGSVAFTMVTIPYSSLTVELTDNPDERATMTGWRMAAAGIGILLTGGAFPILIDPNGLALSHAAAMMVYAPIVVATIWIAAFATFGRRQTDAMEPVGFGTQVRAALRNRRFVVLVIIYGAQTFGIAFITLGIPFAAAELIISSGATGVMATVWVLGSFSTAFALFILGSMLSQAVWVTLSKAIGKQATFVGGTLYYGIVMLGFFFVLPSSEAIATGTTNLGLITLFIFLIGAANGCYQQLPWSIMPDLVDWSAERESFQVAGSFSGLWLLGQKVGNAIAPLVLGQLLALYGWISTTNGGDVTQSPAAVDALRWALTLVPAGLMFISVPIYLLFDRMAAQSQK
ncbi:MAG: MFS transporter [Alphaproteobacteria bacterium TMED89]|nr:MFS transporter [Rhodospirillaceae bacterium]RPH15355.1 MAG: MFS transporter [Alphaproteobacteria bacterium TMED89]